MKAGRDIENSGGMFQGVMEHMGWRTGGRPEMVVEEGKHLRKPEEMTECLSRTYEKKLKKVGGKIGRSSENTKKDDEEES